MQMDWVLLMADEGNKLASSMPCSDFFSKTDETFLKDLKQKIVKKEENIEEEVVE